MRRNKFLSFLLAATLMLGMAACTAQDDTSGSQLETSVDEASATLPDDGQQDMPEAQAQISLYGEQHANEAILQQELELWSQHYHSDGMRHLFIEMPYYTAEFLNIWMQADDDEILELLYESWNGTLSYDPMIKDFYKQIKEDFPETVFHGTDVGHQYQSIGAQFLAYLEENGLEESEQYQLAQESIEQGRQYYVAKDSVYRENKMAENFIREYDQLNGEPIMGIYGAAHTSFTSMDYDTGTVPCMAMQLKDYYGDRIASENLALMAKITEPIRTDIISVGGKEYDALYFGLEELNGFNDLDQQEFWRLENAYDDVKDYPTTGDWLPYDNYLMLVEDGQVFVIDYTTMDGTVVRMYYRADGVEHGGRTITQEFAVE